MSLLLALVLSTAPAEAVLRFACDDKYASKDCDEAAWLKTALEDPHQGHDLLLHQDGGPEGSVWNGDASLYLFVRGAAGNVSFGAVGTVKLQRAGDWRWVRLTSSTWQKALTASKDRLCRRAVIRAGKQPLGEFWFAEGE
jgi:hypothetical protein